MAVLKWMLVVLVIVLINNVVQSSALLRFANYYSDHMVLQMAPKHAVVWGYGQTIGSTVSVSVNGKVVGNVTVKYQPGHATGKVWKALLPVYNAGGPYNITIHSQDGAATIHDVMFGDVWICSGQSNMFFKMSQVFNSTEEIVEASNFPNIRLMQITIKASTVPLVEPYIYTKWQRTGNDAHTGFFSAVCLLYAMKLSPHINRPIGLVETSVGGTPVEAWSSPEVLTACPHNAHGKRATSVNKQNHVLWNAMVHPLLNMTIFGAIWYQGEANSGNPDDYACRFPSMIDSWRKEFNIGSMHQTDKMFPFGFVQLAGNHNSTTRVGGFPAVRWAQTAHFGYVPNARMQNVFMSVAMDLPDYQSPYGTIHPRDKLDVAERLALAGRAVAYGESNLDYQGPLPSRVTLPNNHTMRIEFDHGNSPIEVRDNNGFDVCCSHTNNVTCTIYTYSRVRVIHHDDTSVTLNTSACHGYKPHVTSVRYAWHESPCDVKHCAVYGRDNDLPAPPFIKNMPFQF